MSQYIIRKMKTAHCKRGPQRCEKCREMNVEQICLLDIDPPQRGMLQRRVIEVESDGERTWREFDVARTFESAEEALAYAAAHQIRDVELGD
jgi:hypothetical protein